MFIIFPHQLFEENPYFMKDKNKKILLIEDSLFYYDASKRPFLTHKLKITFLRAAILFYMDFLKKKGYKNVTFLDYDACVNDKVIKKHLQKENIEFIDPHDYDLCKKYKEIAQTNKVDLNIIPDDIMFLLEKKDKDIFHKSHGSKKRIQHVSFFDFSKDKMDILKNVKSQDESNRSNLPFHFVLENSSIRFPESETYLQKALSFVEKHKQFKKHYGDLDIIKSGKNNLKEQIGYPVTHEDAKKYFNAFLDNKFSLYGDYQDATHSDYIILYHSHISHLLNCGLLSPKYILQKIQQKYQTSQKSKNKIPLNAFEGFVRQLLGWREYMIYIYDYHYEEITSCNIMQHTQSIIKNKDWYNGSLDILPIDQEIKKIIKTGYAHHIVRLMFLLNFMVLCRIKKEDIYQWFMEMVALDAYPWVMQTNIAAMGFFSDKFMRKPYLSSSNYIIKMSNYKGDNKWEIIWDALFYNYIKTNEKLIQKHASVYTRNLAYFNKKNEKEKKYIQKIASEFISKNTQ